MNKKMLLINFIFLFAIALSIFLIKQFMDFTTSNQEKNNKNTPDAYMINASYLRTNDEGQPHVIVYSPLVTHYKPHDTSQFQKPEIKVYKNGEEWHLTSKKATGINGATTFYLYDDVKVQQLASKKNAGTMLSTQSLTVFPKRNLVTTKDFVMIEQPGLKISAIGLRGDLNTGNIQLLSKTRGQYDPKQSR